MRCKYCGGEINLSVGRCISCGRGIDATSDIRILHDLGSITEQYGLDPDQAKYDQPLQKKNESQPLDQRTDAQPLPPDLKQAKIPGIQLSTYYELLGDDTPAEEPPEQADDGTQDDQSGTPEETDTSDTEIEAVDADSSSEAPPEDDEDEAPSEGLRAKVEEWIDKLDRLTAPVTERVRQWYNSKMPQMHRAQSSSKWERLAVVGVFVAAVAVVIVLISVIISSIPASISGEWQISEDDSQSLFTVEFSRGEVIARVYDDAGEPHIYKKGTYETSRSNGRDLLTILYDDGTLSNLYYEINGSTGQFVNVGTGSSDSYRRID